jgi:hypothetical protein
MLRVIGGLRIATEQNYYAKKTYAISQRICPLRYNSILLSFADSDMGEGLV